MGASLPRRWVRSYVVECAAGLVYRSSHSRRTPTRISPTQERARPRGPCLSRFGPAHLSAETGVPARTISHTLNRHQIPKLAWCQPVTGDLIRASRSIHFHYEHARPGGLIHVDGKKLGRIPDGGGWCIHCLTANTNDQKNLVGFSYTHAAVDGHTWLAYAEIHPNDKGVTTAGYLTWTAGYSGRHGITSTVRVMSDNAFAYRHPVAFESAIAASLPGGSSSSPSAPWQNGEVEVEVEVDRFNRTLATERPFRQRFTSKADRADAVASRHCTNPHRSRLGSRSPTITNLTAPYNP